MIMVPRPRGNHVLQDQDLRPTLLPPDRREPLGGRTYPTAGRRHPGATRSTPAGRPTRRPPGLGRSPVPVRPPALGPRQGTTPDHHRPTHRARPDLPTSNSRPLECISSCLPHFDSGTVIGRSPQAETEVNRG